MQAVEQAGLEEAGDGHTAALHQDAGEAAPRQREADRLGADPAGGVGQADDLDAGGPVDVAGLDHQPPRAVLGEHPRVGGQAAARVDDHPRRARAVAKAHGQAGIVGQRGAHADHHGIRQRAAAVQVAEPLAARDIRRIAGHRGDAAVERLADLGEEEGRLARRTAGERGVEVEGGSGRVGPGGIGQDGALTRPQGSQRRPDRLRHRCRSHPEPSLLPPAGRSPLI